MVQVFDSWAGELSPPSFAEFALPYLQYIAVELRKRTNQARAKGAGGVPMTVFAKGAWYALDELCKSSYDVVGLDWLHDPAEAYRTAQAHGTVVQGNADPGVLYGSRPAVTRVVEDMARGFGGGSQGWIANLGHGTSGAAAWAALTAVHRHHAVCRPGQPAVSSWTKCTGSHKGRRALQGRHRTVFVGSGPMNLQQHR